MQTIDIPQRDWGRTLEEFSLSHDGSIVTLEVLWPDIGAQAQINALPLLAISADMKDPEPAIVIDAGNRDGEHVSHVIDSPIRVRLTRTDDGQDAAIEIESESGVTNILRLHANPAQPEHLLQQGQ